MSRLRIELQPAYLLHTRSYGDSSLLVEAFTPDFGRVGLIARGARAPKARSRSHLQVLTPLLLSWQQRGELGTLIVAEAQGRTVPLVGEALFCAWYANELLMRLCSRDDPHPVLFAAYHSLLLRLDHAPEPALRSFERRLLEEIGYGLQLPDDLDPALRYRYDWERGPVPSSIDADGPDCLSGASLIAFRDDQLDDARQRQEIRRLMRRALQRHLGGRPLESARLLRELRMLSATDRGSGSEEAPA